MIPPARFPSPEARADSNESGKTVMHVMKSDRMRQVLQLLECSHQCNPSDLNLRQYEVLRNGSRRQGLTRPLAANPSCGSDRFSFQRRVGVTDGSALINVSLEKRKNAAQPLILRGVDELMSNQRAITPMICTDKNSVIQCQATGCGT